MKIAVTGADGFLGWHVRCRAFARGLECVPVGRATMSDPDRLAEVVRGVDAVVHCAGVNRGTDVEITEGNLAPAGRLAEAVGRAGRPVRVVYANSVHARRDTAYGVAKRKAAGVLAGTAPAPELSDVVLPNLYGEHGRAHYNSFVATFCHELAAGREPADVRDAEVGLLHAQDAAGILLDEAGATGHRLVEPPAGPATVGGVLATLREFRARYVDGELPDLADPMRVRLFNTYRSYLVAALVHPTAHTDARGTLVECVRAGSGGQAFVSSTGPGGVRGEHVHLRKVERFVVVAGEAEIALRRLFSTDVIQLRVNGVVPAIVDMPTMWAHKLTNVGDGTVTTFFWTNELYRADDADTYPCTVDGAGSGP